MPITIFAPVIANTINSEFAVLFFSPKPFFQQCIDNTTKKIIVAFRKYFRHFRNLLIKNKTTLEITLRGFTVV